MMVLWRGLGVLAALTPVVIFLPWPKDPIFYCIVTVVGIITGVYERQTYYVAGQGNAGGLSRLLPLTIWVTFIIWIIISSRIRTDYAAHPLHALAIFGALGICGAGVFLMQQAVVDARLFRDVMPIVILRGITDVLNKTAMNHSAEIFPANIAIYVWWAAAWLTLTTLFLNWRATGKIMPDNPFRRIYIKPAIVISSIMLLIMACKTTAMNFAPNPAYVTATALLSALWVTLYHRLRREPDPSNLWAGALIVAGTFGLVLAGG